MGTDASGTAARGNTEYGVEIAGANDTVGGATASARNVLTANGGADVLTDQTGTKNVIAGNFIGTDISGAKAIPSTLGGTPGGVVDGVGVGLFGTGNTLGGTTTPERNVIAGHISVGVSLGSFSGASNGARVVGNFIGTDLTGTKALPNNIGVVAYGTGNVIGGTAPGERNVISGNMGAGVSLYASGTTVAGNFIGTDATGMKAVPNTGPGFSLFGDEGTTIGGNAPGAGNLISGNGLQGIFAARSGYADRRQPDRDGRSRRPARQWRRRDFYLFLSRQRLPQ